MRILLIHTRLVDYFSSNTQLVRSLSSYIATTIVIIASCTLLSCSSTTSKNRTNSLRVKVDPQLTDVENLRRLAKAEKTAARLAPLQVPPPPGVDPHILASKSQIDSTAFLTLDQALKEISNQFFSETRELPEISELNSQSQAVALRHYLKGREAAFQNKHFIAINEFNNSLAIDPYNPNVLRESAKSFLASNRRLQALNRFGRLLQVMPNDSQAMFEVGASAAFKQQHIEAIARLGHPRITGKSFEHDEGADYVASFILQESLRKLGYDRASIQIAKQVIDNPYQNLKPSVYVKRIESIYMQRSETWKKVGDAHCRLSEFAKALDAYEVASSLPISDPEPILARIIYTNLRLGRGYGSQLKLLEDMQSKQLAIGENAVLLCQYIVSHVTDTSLLADAVSDIYKDNTDDPQIARAAAALLSPQDAVLLLRQFLQQRPEDLKVVSQLLEWLLKDDSRIAVELTAKMCADRPQYAKNYCKRLAVASPDIAVLFDTINQLPSTASTTLVNAQLLFYVDGIGQAWDVCENALENWPSDLGLLLLQLDIAASLKDPQLFNKVRDPLDQFNDVATWIAQAQACRVIGNTTAAIEASKKALQLDLQSTEATTEHARCFAHHALVIGDPQQQSNFAHQAITKAERAINHNPQYEDAYAVLFEIYDKAGPFPSAQLHDQTAIRLRSSLPDSILLKRIKAQREGRLGLLEKSVEQFLSLYENDPNDSISLDLAITSWTRQGNAPAAQEWIDQRLKLKPDDPDLLKQWARVRLQHRRSDEVIEKMQGIIEKHSINFVAKDILASTYRLLGQTEKYVDIAHARLLTRPKGFRREIELAVLLIQAKRFDEARQRLVWVYESKEQATHGQLLSAITIAGEIPSANKLVLDYSNYIFDRFSSTPMIVYGSALRALARLGQLDKNFDKWADRAASDIRSFEYNSAYYIRQWQQLMQLLIDAKQPLAASRAIRAPFRLDNPLSTVETDKLLTLAIVADTASDQSAATIELIRDLSINGLLPAVAGRPVGSDLDGLTETFFAAAQTFSMLGKEEGAVQILKQAVIVNPNHALAHNNLGYARLELGATDGDMIESIEKAFELQPNEPNIIDTIGWLRYKQGRFADVDELHGAVTLVELAMRLDTNVSTEVFDHVGDARWRAGDNTGAVQAWQNAVRLLNNPGHRLQWIEVYTRLQADPKQWGLVVSDPKVLYHDNFGIVLDRISAKLDAVKLGKQPKTAPIFAEYISQTNSGDTQDGRP